MPRAHADYFAATTKLRARLAAQRYYRREVEALRREQERLRALEPSADEASGKLGETKEGRGEFIVASAKTTMAFTFT